MPENRDGYPILRIGMIHQKAEVHHTECKSVCNCRHVALAAPQVCAPGMYIDTFARHDISEGDDVRDGRKKKNSCLHVDIPKGSHYTTRVMSMR